MEEALAQYRVAYRKDHDKEEVPSIVTIETLHDESYSGHVFSVVARDAIVMDGRSEGTPPLFTKRELVQLILLGVLIAGTVAFTAPFLM